MRRRDREMARSSMRSPWMVALIVAFATAAILPPVAAAAPPSGGKPLVKFGSTGSGSSQFQNATGIATDPVSGHIFIADNDNARIDEFTAWGDFVKAFGWDVAPGPVNEQQEVIVRAASGQFRLSFEGSPTGDLQHDAPASALEAALDGLASLTGGGVTVSEGPRDATSTRYVVAFSEGNRAGDDVEAMVASDGTTPLGGGTPTSGITVVTRADGTPGGVGLEACTAESGCKAGTSGSGSGQVQAPSGIAVDSAGGVYVRERPDIDPRVQKFDLAGRFVWMLGKGVNKTSGENLCTAASEDECGAAAIGTGQGEFTKGFNVALSAAGALMVPDQERIQVFDTAGTYQSSVALPGLIARNMAVDTTTGNLFV